MLCLQTELLCVAQSHTSGGPSQIISCESQCVHKFLSLPPCFSSKKKRSRLSFVIKNVWNWGQTAWYAALWWASESGGLLWLVVNWSLQQLLLRPLSRGDKNCCVSDQFNGCFLKNSQGTKTFLSCYHAFVFSLYSKRQLFGTVSSNLSWSLNYYHPIMWYSINSQWWKFASASSRGRSHDKVICFRCRT